MAGAHFWSRVRIQDRPAFQEVGADHGIVARRIFYFSHFFDAALEIAGVASTREGRLFFLVRRVWVDRWSGMSSVKRKLGHRLIAGQLREEIEAGGLCGP